MPDSIKSKRCLFDRCHLFTFCNLDNTAHIYAQVAGLHLQITRILCSNLLLLVKKCMNCFIKGTLLYIS